jgi:flagellar hook-associated protein 1
MSLSGLYDIGKSALIASQTALAVTSNNIANVNTPGYTKESVTLEIASPFSSGAGPIGSGVTATGIARSYDNFIQAQLLNQQQNQSRSASLDQTWGQVEQVLNEAQGIGLSGPLSDFFNAWNDVATTPDSPAARAVLLQKANALVRSASTIERSIVDTVNNSNSTIATDTKQINSIASDIASLNQQIVAAEAGNGGTQANDLRDQRDAKLTALAKLVDFTSYQDQNGSLTVVVGMRNLVSGVQTNPVSTGADTNGNTAVILDNTDITSNIQGGDIGGLIQSRTDIQTKTLAGLRMLVASVVQQVNSLQTAGYDLNGNQGVNFFTPLSVPTANNSASATITPPTVTGPSALTSDEYMVNFNAAGTTYSISNKQTGAVLVPPSAYTSGTPIAFNGLSFTISGTVTNTDSFTIGSPLPTAISNFSVAITDPTEVAAASTVASPGPPPIPNPGDNGNALLIAQLANNTISSLGDTFSGYYNGVVSTVGSIRQSTSDGLTFDNNLLSQIQARRDSASGVSLDEEATNLINFQRSYQAGAKLITVADELVQSVLSLVS